MSLVGKWIKIQSYKHDGNLHRFWSRSYVLVDDEDWLIVASRRTQVAESNGREWYTKEPAVSFFSKKEWFNVIAMFKTQGLAFYSNIASPTLIDGFTAKYIDYDLDIKKNTDGSIKLLDKNEFIRNGKSYGYDETLIKVITHQNEKVLKKILNNEYPFDEAEVKNLFDLFLNRNK